MALELNLGILESTSPFSIIAKSSGLHLSKTVCTISGNIPSNDGMSKWKYKHDPKRASCAIPKRRALSASQKHAAQGTAGVCGNNL